MVTEGTTRWKVYKIFSIKDATIQPSVWFTQAKFERDPEIRAFLINLNGEKEIFHNIRKNSVSDKTICLIMVYPFLEPIKAGKSKSKTKAIPHATICKKKFFRTSIRKIVVQNANL